MLIVQVRYVLVRSQIRLSLILIPLVSITSGYHQLLRWILGCGGEHRRIAGLIGLTVKSTVELTVKSTVELTVKSTVVSTVKLTFC